jgi:hypothetical protein
MNVEFYDLEAEDSADNGTVISAASDALALIRKRRQTRAPFMCELIGDNSMILTIGISPNFGCAQYASSDGLPPYLMGVDGTHDVPDIDEMEFAVGGTATPIDRRYLLKAEVVDEIVEAFVTTGEPCKRLAWEEFN